MTIESYRFRNEDALVVLQVLERDQPSPYSHVRDAKWRDALTQDLLDVARLIRPETIYRVTKNRIDTRGLAGALEDCDEYRKMHC